MAENLNLETVQGVDNLAKMVEKINYTIENANLANNKIANLDDKNLVSVENIEKLDQSIEMTKKDLLKTNKDVLLEIDKSISLVGGNLDEHSKGEDINKSLHVIKDELKNKYFLQDGEEIQMAGDLNYFNSTRGQSGKDFTKVRINGQALQQNALFYEDEAFYYVFITNVAIPFKINKETLEVTQLASGTASTFAHLGCEMNGKIYLSHNSSYNSYVYEYTIETNRWNNSSNMNYAYGRLFPLTENEIVIFPYTGQPNLYKYNITNKGFYGLANIPTNDTSYGLFEEYEGKFYRVSTYTSYPVYIYDPVSNKWETTTVRPPITITNPHLYQNWFLRKDNKLYVMDTTTGSFLVFNFETGKYETLPNVRFFNVNDSFKFINDNLILICNARTDNNQSRIYKIDTQETLVIGNMYSISSETGSYNHFLGDYLLSTPIGSNDIAFNPKFEGVKFHKAIPNDLIYTSGIFTDEDNNFYESNKEHTIEKETDLFLYPGTNDNIFGWTRR